MPFIRFLIWSSCGPPVQWSGFTYAILKECIMGNIHVKFYEKNVVQEEMSFKEKVYGRWKTDNRCMTGTGPRPITIPHLEPLAQVS